MKEKIHRHMIESVAQALSEIFFENRYADKVIEKNMKGQRQWGARDRRFFAENVYSCVRWWRKYWFLLGEEPSQDKAQLIRLWAVHRLSTGQELPEDSLKWSEISGLKLSADRLAQAENNLAIKESIPDWLNEQGEREMGEKWPSILRALNQTAPVDLRINPLRKSKKQVQEILKDEGVETDFIPGVELGLTLRERKNIFPLKSFHEGLFEVQDRASQLVAPILQVEAGMRVIDACAGAGGKTLHLAQLMGNKGKIISMDIHEFKLKELRTRVTRNKIDIVETKWIESSKVIKRLEKTADRVLLDVPCTGLGVLRRNPDAKWKLKPENVLELLRLQKEILFSYSQMVKNGGALVYATCSFFPTEDEKQVENFLSEQSSQWTLEESVHVNPDEGRGDGFFAARLRRK